MERLVSVLDGLRAGQRLWFWFCPEVADDQPVLLLQPLREDPLMEDLQRLADAVELPRQATPSVGLAYVQPNGRLQLGGVLLDRGGLTRLAGWATANVGERPALSRLRGTRFVRTDLGGQVVERVEDDALWRELPSATIPNTPRHSARRLAELAPGEDAWFWMTDRGPDGHPFFLLQPASRDPDGAAFASQIREAGLRTPDLGREARAIARLSGESLLLLTSAPEQAAPILEALRERFGRHAPRLSDARIAGLDAGPLARTAAVLSGLGEEPIWFWLTHRDASGAPLLLLETDRDALKAAAQRAGGDGPTARGRARRTPSGWIEFRTQAPDPDFLQALIAWAARHHGQQPALRALRGARMTHRDGSETLDRQRDDAAWSTLFGEER